MTIRVGLNPSGKMYVGPMAGSGKKSGTGDVSVKATFAGDAVRRSVGSGALTLKAPAIEAVAVHPRIGRGPGNVQLPKAAMAGASANTQHPNGSGAMSARLTMAGTALRRVAGVAIFDSELLLPAKIVFSGTGTISRRYITGSGDLSFGSLTVKDVTPVNTIRVIDIEGAFVDPEIEGVFLEAFDIEGVG